MIIEINAQGEIVAQATGLAAQGLSANGKTMFEVDAIPQKEKGCVLCFDPETGSYYQKEKLLPDLETRRAAAKKAAAIRLAEQKRQAALNWLAENDWKINKRLLGEWSEEDARWQAYLCDRARARAEIDAAAAVLTAK